VSPALHRLPSTRNRRGFTFVELLMSLTLMSILSVVLGGMILAAHDGWEHSNGLTEANQQARISQDRIAYMVSQAGQYKPAGQPTTLGIAVVEQTYLLVKSPEILVIWSGGRMGGMAANGVLTRLPTVNELVIYTPDPSDPTHLVEVVDPNNVNSLDFRAANFSTSVKTILKSPSCQKTLLCDRVHTSNLSMFSFSQTAVGNIRFEKLDSPTDTELSGIVAGTPAWFNLVWAQGIVSSSTGMRQSTIRMEFQVEPRPLPLNSSAAVSAIPFFNSASNRYVYQP
jgi:prepilin-type N-terminal cleavage/methylation domain-containing protein